MSTTTATERLRGRRGRRVLVVFHEEVRGGATISVLRLVPELARRGWEMVFWTPRPSRLYDSLQAEGFVVRGAPRPIAYSAAALRLPPGPTKRAARTPHYLLDFARTVRELAPDLIHANSVTTLAEGAVARALRVPVLMHIHEMIGTSRKARASALAVHTISNELVAVSRPCANALTVREHRPRVVHECVPIPNQPSSGSDGPELVVGTVGVVSRRKGSDLFVEAAQLLGDEAGIRFEMVGAPTDPLDAAWATEVLARAAEVGVRHRSEADVQQMLEGWDLFVLPSRVDPFPIAMLEAMAAGLPVVGTEVDGIAEMLADGAGILCPAEDPEALADSIRVLARREAERRSLGEAARSRVASRYSLAHQVDGIDRAYRAALTSNG